MKQFNPNQAKYQCRRCKQQCNRGSSPIPHCYKCQNLGTGEKCGKCRGISLTTKCKFKEIVK